MTTQRLVIDVPDEVFQAMKSAAEQTGRPVEYVAVDWLARYSPEVSSDPLSTIVGMIDSGMPGWSDQHDKYFGSPAGDAT